MLSSNVSPRYQSGASENLLENCLDPKTKLKDSNPPKASSAQPYIHQAENDNNRPSTSTDTPLALRDIKKERLKEHEFQDKYKELSECISKGDNSRINNLLINHVRSIDNLCNRQEGKVLFSMSHQQFIMYLCNSNNVTEIFHYENGDLDLCIDNLNRLLNNITLFVQECFEVNKGNTQTIATYVAIQPIWLYNKKQLLHAESLINLTSLQIKQIISKLDTNIRFTSKYRGKGFNKIIQDFAIKDITTNNLKRKHTGKSGGNISNKRKKVENIASSQKVNAMLINHREKVKQVCDANGIIYSDIHDKVLGYCKNYNAYSLFDNEKNHLLDKFLDKLLLIITESTKYNIIRFTSIFITPIFDGNFINLRSFLSIPDELIKNPDTNKKIFKYIKSKNIRFLHSTGYPNVADII